MSASSPVPDIHESRSDRTTGSTFGLLLRPILKRLFSHVSFDSDQIRRLKELPKDQSVVYVMPSASVLDYLLMNTIALQQDLPLARYGNDLPMLWLQPFRAAIATGLSHLRGLFRSRAFRVREDCRFVIEHAGRRETVLLFLNRPRVWFRPLRWNVLVWEELIRAQRKNRFNAVLVPVTLLWGRQPDLLQRSFLDVFLGGVNTPGSIRKAYHFLRHFRDIHLNIGQPVELARFLEKVEPGRAEVVAKKLRRFLSNYLYRERKLILGPPLRSRERIVRVLLKDPDLKQLVASVAHREKKTEKEIWKRAERILYEMLPNFRHFYFDVCYVIFRRIWNRLFGELHVDEEGLSKLKKVMLDYPVILLPSHKSHMDYLLLSSIFYEHRMMPPYIASGINLAFFPMGHIFRSTGAYFIRRKIATDLLYARLLALYVRWLLRTGYSQEFFLEGGRSRTGKLVRPKHGLLSMQIEAFLSGASRDLFIVPIAISYERVPEEGSYRAELAGLEKRRESFWSLLQSRKLLRRFYGSVHVRFAEPVSVRDFFQLQPGVPVSTKERKAKTLHLAEEVVRSIASETVVTASALGATALLSQPENGVLLSVFRERLVLLKEHLKSVGASLSPTIESAAEGEVRSIVTFFANNRWIDVIDSDAEDPRIVIREDKRPTLDYYKNTSLHYFLPLASCALSSKLEDVRLLHEIFAFEFPLRPSESAESFLEQSRPYLESKSGDLPFVRLFSGLIMNYLESYELAGQVALKEKLVSVAGKETIRNALGIGNQLLAEGSLTRREALSALNLQSAFRLLYEKGFLASPEKLGQFTDRLRQLRGR